MANTLQVKGKQMHKVSVVMQENSLKTKKKTFLKKIIGFDEVAKML